MKIRRRFDALLARQLGHPAGLAGRLVARGLNRGNRRTIEDAVEALSSGSDAVIADVGFGGGIGLRLLLDRHGAATVHGVELSCSMIKRAQAAFADDIATGRLYIHHASIAGLPFAAHGFRLRSIADIETALSRAGLTLIEHRRVGERCNPAHLLVTTPTQSGHGAEK